MKRSAAVMIMAVGLVMMGAFQNCAGRASFSTTEASVAGSAGAAGAAGGSSDPVVALPADPSVPGSTPIVLPTAVPTPDSTPAPNAVCDPLKTSGSSACSTSTAGLLGNLYYLTSDQVGAYSNGVNNYIQHGTEVSTPVVLSDLDIPVHSFTEGFTPAGSSSALTMSNGQLLTEYFALDLKGYLTLSSQYASGYYQFETISDDGSKLFLNDSVVVDNDNTQSMHAAVSQPVLLATGAAVAMHLQYYQGPKTEIGLQVYMRKCVSADVNSCTDQWMIIPAAFLSY